MNNPRGELEKITNQLDQLSNENTTVLNELTGLRRMLALVDPTPEEKKKLDGLNKRLNQIKSKLRSLETKKLELGFQIEDLEEKGRSDPSATAKEDAVTVLRELAPDFVEAGLLDFRGIGIEWEGKVLHSLGPEAFSLFREFLAAAERYGDLTHRPGRRRQILFQEDFETLFQRCQEKVAN